jgi:ADP-heptose:LPS heptosyltransferase
MSSAPIWGYATRSQKSACIMLAVDLLNPFKRHTPLTWGNRNLAASIAGLGDLILHLPLLSTLVHRARKKNVSLEIALRPAHAEIGRRLGWNVLPIENPLQSIFNRKATLPQLVEAWKKSVHQLRANPYDLCLDLGGSAFDAVLFKRGGVARLASRKTRGGASLIDHVLEHTPFENEYLYRERLAASLEITPDFSVYEKLASFPRPRTEIILAVTTSCRWRNWPLRDFLQLTGAFPDEQFVLVGHLEEVSEKDWEDLMRLEASSNLQNLLGRLSPLQLIERIAAAKSIVANDSAAAHIANAFRVPGVVLFGPEDSATWAMPGGLEVLHDKTCPYFPCVQWRCKNPANWCMEKISPGAVISQLAKTLAAAH